MPSENSRACCTRGEPLATIRIRSARLIGYKELREVDIAWPFNFPARLQIPASTMNPEFEVAAVENLARSRPVERTVIDVHIITLGHVLFAAGLVGVGLLSLGSGDFAYTWQPVPDWVVWRTGFARLSGFLLSGTGIALLIRRSSAKGAIVISFYLALLMLSLHLPRVLYSPADVGRWLGLCENLTLVCGGWILALSVSRWETESPGKIWTNLRIPQLLYAGACVVFGVSHFVYADATAGMVPAWLPYRMGFAYLAGAGHFAAGIAMLSGIVPGLAAILEAGMISSFVLLVHIPGVFSDPHSRLQWTMLSVASALAGAAWLLAASFQTTIWRRKRFGV